MVMTGDIDAAAETLYRAAGYSTSEQAPPLALAERLLGDGSVRTAPAHAMASRGALVRIGGAWRIYLNAACDPCRKRFVLLHELAHWALPDATEEQCNRLAGALLLPRRAYLGLATGRAMSRIARIFGTDESCAWLRLGEATGRPLALVTPQTVRVRGEEFSWPECTAIRELAEARTAPGLRRTRVNDAPNRLVLRSA